jgi:NADH:ubiquinone oxidoreductase subunit E
MQPINQPSRCGCDCSPSEEFKQLELILQELKDVPGSLIIILQKAQSLYGYLSRDVISHIAKTTGITQAKIYGVATFYTQFRLKPIGKYLIMLCQGTACHVSGSKKIEEIIVKVLNVKDGETTADGLFTLNNVACLGCCSLAPVMMIQSEGNDETYGNLDADKVRAVLKDLREKERV